MLIAQTQVRAESTTAAVILNLLIWIKEVLIIAALIKYLLA